MNPLRPRLKRNASAAICIAAALVFGNTARAEDIMTSAAIEIAARTLPPFPQQVIDEVNFTNRVSGPYAYYNMCHQPADAFRCALDKRPEPNHKPRTLTLTDWVVIHTVLNTLHRNFKPIEDIKKHKKTDVWTHNDEGDCEDFALQFKKILTQQYGWEEHELLMGVVWDEKKRGHAVMVMRTDRGYWAADLRRYHLRRMEETNYTSNMIQTPLNRFEWASIKGRTVFAQIPVWKASIVTATAQKEQKGKFRKKQPVALRGTLP